MLASLVRIDCLSCARACATRQAVLVHARRLCSKVKVMGPSAAANDWQRNLLTDRNQILQIAAQAATVAVLGIKTEKQAEQPAFYVPEYLQEAGLYIIPVPVYYPDVTEILGQPVYRKVADIPEPIDILDVFRRPSDIPAHLADILAAKPKTVWLQSGISNAEAEEVLARAGIQVVVDRCLMMDHRAAVAAGLKAKM